MKYFEDVQVGDSFVSPEPYHVTRDELMSFARQWDPQPYHLDEAEAEKLDGALFAPAALTICISIKLTHEAGYFEIRPVAGLGFEDVQLAKPVFVDDRLTARITVVGKRDSKSRPGLGVLSQRTELFNQNEELVISYMIPSLVYKRPG